MAFLYFAHLNFVIYNSLKGHGAKIQWEDGSSTKLFGLLVCKVIAIESAVVFAITTKSYTPSYLYNTYLRNSDGPSECIILASACTYIYIYAMLGSLYAAPADKDKIASDVFCFV